MKKNPLRQRLNGKQCAVGNCGIIRIARRHGLLYQQSEWRFAMSDTTDNTTNSPPKLPTGAVMLIDLKGTSELILPSGDYIRSCGNDMRRLWDRILEMQHVLAHPEYADDINIYAHNLLIEQAMITFTEPIITYANEDLHRLSKN